jgi:ribonuclease R
VSWVADVEAKLTVAEGTAGLQRRRRNGLGTAAGNGGGALACAQRGGEGKGGSAGAQMREGERVGEALGSSGRGRGGCELHVRRGRGDRGTRSSGGGYAGTRELTARAREQRERGSGRARGESGCADGRARQGRERRGGRHARGMG